MNNEPPEKHRTLLDACSHRIFELDYGTYADKTIEFLIGIAVCRLHSNFDYMTRAWDLFRIRLSNANC